MNKAEMFNKKASSENSRPDEILRLLGLKRGQKVVDLGAGGGYFTLRFAEAVGKEGKVYAVDVNPLFLELIKESAKQQGHANIEDVITNEDSPCLPVVDIDMIFLRNVYHHVKNRIEYFSNMKQFLGPKGKLVIIEHKEKAGSFFSFRRLFGHNTPKNTIIEEITNAGYKLSDDHDVLPDQHFLVFMP